MHLYRRRGTFHFRIRTPQDLLEAIQSPELIKSLKTKDRKLAQTAVKPYAQKTQEVFTLLRIGMLSPDQAQERLDTILQRKRPALTPTPVGEVTLAAAVKQFIADRQHGWGPKTKLENEGTYRLVVDLLGDMPVRSISRPGARDLREKLLRLPANVYKVFPGKSAREVLAIQDLTPMSITSVNKHVTRFSTLMKYCRDEYGIDDNPALGLSIRQKRRSDEERKAYSQEDIGNLVAALPAPSGKPERYWVPLIGVYSGMRLDEIAQLYTSDVKEIDGTWCFDINEDEDKKLKTLSSRRIVPVHPRLLELGLMDYVEGVRRQEHPRVPHGDLFFVITRNPRSNRSEANFFTVLGKLLETVPLDPATLVPFDENAFACIDRKAYTLVINNVTKGVGFMLDSWHDSHYEQGVLQLATYRPVGMPYKSQGLAVCDVEEIWVALDVCAE